MYGMQLHIWKDTDSLTHFDIHKRASTIQAKGIQSETTWAHVQKRISVKHGAQIHGNSFSWIVVS